MDLKETDILGDRISEHWYYRYKAQAMMRMLSEEKITRILDIGAGSGFFSRYLLNHSSARDAWCVDISYPEDSDLDEHGKPIHFRRSIEYVDADLVLLMDVLEHVEDDIGLLSEYVSRVPNNTSFLISVPAFQFLWSGHDIFLEHKRRYSLSQLESVVKSAGLTLKQGVYYFGAVFPIAASIRILSNVLGRKAQQPRSQLRRHHPLVNSALARLSQAELPFLKNNRLAGLTVFCLAQSR